MAKHRYILEPYKGPASRYRCPQCNRREKTFVRYIDTETGQHLAPHAGRCNRQVNCAYHYTPKQYFEDNKPLLAAGYGSTSHGTYGTCGTSWDIQKQSRRSPVWHNTVAKPISFINKSIFAQSLQHYERNNLALYLQTVFAEKNVEEMLRQSKGVGTSRYWPGATVFWQIDEQQQVRTGKIMLYNAGTGKRVRQPFNHVHWVHSVLKLPAFNLQQCFFGQHLLPVSNKPVAIVESEKTALVAGIYMPEFTWLAAGSLDNLTPQRCMVLKGRHVTLYPDLGGFEKWSQKAAALAQITNVSVSDILEKHASPTEREQGFDLADYLLRFEVWGLRFEV